ncbi:MAG: dihydroneopterin aldolase [Sneathiella sp.]|nr:dihydroneopterin aldolase [Sneathiella sp.]
MEHNKIQSLPRQEVAVATHTIFISDLVVDMMIGVYDFEKLKSQPVRLNIEMTVLDHVGPINDDYHNVVCYETIANTVKKLVQEEHINLVETLAEKVSEICLDHQRVTEAKIKVEKLSAVKDAASVGIEITRIKR